jgi:hypothetical protein
MAPQRLANEVAAKGELLETVPLVQAQRRPDLTSVTTLSTGDTAIVDPSGIVHAVWPSSQWPEIDVPIPLVPLTNGAETVLLLISQNGIPLNPGRYTLDFVLDRTRWPSSGSPAPKQLYHQERAVQLHW